MQIYLADIGSSSNSCASTTTLRRTPKFFYTQTYIHIPAIHFMTSTKGKVTGSFSPFIKVITDKLFSIYQGDNWYLCN